MIFLFEKKKKAQIYSFSILIINYLLLFKFYLLDFFFKKEKEE